ncbi:hypothetical protein C8R48DRAFT_780543 [Suillus tomentosus]|nr:hypothetical protein C8R48DRAFT_780543 [Suillus tomentosus]
MNRAARFVLAQTATLPTWQAELLIRLATVLDDNDDDLSEFASDDNLDCLSDPDADFFACCLEGPDRELDTIFGV